MIRVQISEGPECFAIFLCICHYLPFFTELYNELKRMSVAYFPVSEVRIFFNFLPHLEPKVDQKGTKIFEKRRDNQMSVK